MNYDAISIPFEHAVVDLKQKMEFIFMAHALEIYQGVDGSFLVIESMYGEAVLLKTHA